MIIFYLTSLLSVFLCYIAEKKNSIKIAVLAALLLSWISGYRDYSVGTDTIHYYQYFRIILNGQEGLFEFGFELLLKKIYIMFSDLRYMFVLVSVLTNVLIYLRLWDFRETCSFSFMSVVYVCIFFPQTMNIIRQFLAIAVLFYFSRFISKNNLIFILAVIIASSIHTSSLIMILILLWHYLIFEEFSEKKVITLIVASLVITGVTLKVLNVFQSEYIGYFAEKSTGLSFINIIRVFICLIYLMLLKTNNNILFTNSVENTAEYNNSLFITVTYLAGIVLCIVFSAYDQLVRIGSFFIIFELPFVGMAVKNNRYKVIYQLLYIFLCFYYLVIKVTINGECGINNFKLDLG